MRKALRKIYSNDDEYIDAMDNHYKYFNVTPQMGNIILGATLAMEEKDGIEAKDAVQSLKTSLMGPLSGVGDSVFWILIPTIMVLHLLVVIGMLLIIKLSSLTKTTLFS